MAKLVEVKENKKTTKNKINLGKIKDIIDDNPEAVNKIKEGVTDILTSKITGKKSATKKSTKKSSKSTKKSSSSDGLSKVLDLAGSFLKK